MGKKSYEQRNDVEKIQSQWHKLTGLHSREEWSAAVGEFVNNLLRWANGLDGKLNRLLLPLTQGKKLTKSLAALRKMQKR